MVASPNLIVKSANWDTGAISFHALGKSFEGRVCHMCTTNFRSDHVDSVHCDKCAFDTAIQEGV